MIALPIDPFLREITEHVRTARAAVIVASPGAGKTTRVPPALAVDGAVLILQPRRVAARAMAARVADEQRWTLGREVGWHVRFDRRFSPDTRVLFATEGVLTARLQHDPLLTGVRTIILDEFHERKLYADVGLALARQAWLARDDLRIVVMSATLDPDPISAFLGGCPIVTVPGRTFPLEITYSPGTSINDAVVELLPRSTGAILCFLPGAGEIRRAADAIARIAGVSVPVFPLHGGLDADAQDAAIRPSGGPRIILATNLAETTLTVPDVTSVVDTGTHKVARYDPARGIDSLDLERVSQDAADQRAGRAGRVQAGIVRRLWDARDRLRAHREPEILRVDLASTYLDVIAWGGDPDTFEWFERPAPHALDAAAEVLQRLGAIDHAKRLTALGAQLRRVPLHPRLARLLLAAYGAPVAARACALLSERQFVPARRQATACDVLAAIDDIHALPPHVVRAARDIGSVAADVLGAAARGSVTDETFRRAVLAGYPDRVARRRAPKSDRFVLASGSGAVLSRESGVFDGEFVVAVDVTAGIAAGHDALIRLATSIDPMWLEPTSDEMRHVYDPASGSVRATRVALYGQLALRKHSVPCDPVVEARILADEYRRRGPTAGDEQIRRRLAFAGIACDLDALISVAAVSVHRLGDISLSRALTPSLRHTLDRDAPATLRVPSGRDRPLDYRDDGSVMASVKLQELFGLADTPRVGPRRAPITFELLAPNGRPVQITKDLKSFWERGYVEVRRELRGRYPKHPWPDDPWTATPTARAKPRR